MRLWSRRSRERHAAWRLLLTALVAQAVVAQPSEPLGPSSASEGGAACALAREFVFGDPLTGAWPAPGNSSTPPLFRECHASTLLEVPAGRAPGVTEGDAQGPGHLLAAWFAGTREGAEDVEIWLARRSLASNGSWSTPQRVSPGRSGDSAALPSWNPVLFSDPHALRTEDRSEPASVELFYKVGPNPRQWWGMVQESRDGGRHWSAPRRLPGDFLGPIRSKPLALSDGSLLMGSSSEHDGWRTHFELRTASGVWQKIEVPGQRAGATLPSQIDAIQPTLLQHSPEQLQALMRTRQGFVATSWSADAGATWSALRLTELPNPSSGVEGLTLRDGTHLLIYNHTSPDSDGPWVRTRSRLDVALSRDGRTWYALASLENDLEPPSPAAQRKATPVVQSTATNQENERYGEYSYPAAIQTRDGLVHISYTWRRRNLRHVTVDPECWGRWQLPERRIRGGRWPQL